jgi:hypothetical protein
MSAEKITSNVQNPSSLMNSEASKEKHSGRVDINHLLARVRDEQKKVNKTNLIYFCFFGIILLFVGITLSL